MLGIDDIFGYWETLAEMARDLAVPYQTVAKWSQRGRIPSEFWGKVIDRASRRGMPLTYEDLATANPPRQSASSAVSGPNC